MKKARAMEPKTFGEIESQSDCTLLPSVYGVEYTEEHFEDEDDDTAFVKSNTDANANANSNSNSTIAGIPRRFLLAGAAVLFLVVVITVTVTSTTTKTRNQQPLDLAATDYDSGCSNNEIKDSTDNNNAANTNNTFQITQDMIDYYDRLNREAREEEQKEADRMRVIEENLKSANEFFGMSDAEISAKYNRTERKYDGTVRRSLQDATTYHDPVCSVSPPSDDSCIPITSGSTDSPFVIGCGLCYRIAVTDASTLTFSGGLEIKGKLYLDSTASVTIRTPYVFVFGELKVDLPNEGNEVIFDLYGDAEHSFLAPSATSLCGTGTGCNMGTKAIAVLGGKVDITGYDDECPAWEKLIQVGPPVKRDFKFPCPAGVVPEDGKDCIELEMAGPCLKQDYHTAQENKEVIQCPIETTGVVLDDDTNEMIFTSVAPESPGEWEAPADNFDMQLHFPCFFSQHHADVYNECTLLCTLHATTEVFTGDTHQLTFTSEAPAVPTVYQPSALLLTVGACFESPTHKSPISGTNGMACPLHLTSNVLDSHAGPFIFKNTQNGLEIPVSEGVLHWAFIGQYIYFFPDAGVTLADVNAAFPIFSFITVLNAAPSGSEFAVSKVHSWSIGQTALIFSPKDYSIFECQRAANDFNAMFPSGYGIDAKYATVDQSQNGQTVTVSKVIHFSYDGKWIFFAPDVSAEEFSTRFPVGHKIKVDYTTAFDQNSLIVSQDAINCWKPGTELLITSHTRVDDDKQFVKVKSVGVDPSTGLSILQLEQNIVRPITLLDSADFAVEIASLTRRVKFVAESTTGNSLIGGHFIIHNTQTLQSIKGVEITNFGQQGILGKYPLHFHDCGNSFGSIVKNNVIRDSNQRGYVIHLTNYVSLERNVAVGVVGHCYFLEAGTEQKNIFSGNLGAGILKMPLASVNSLTASSGRAESDDEASVFWISNAANSFFGNIAAGSERFGIWFETTQERVFTTLDAFYFNEIHSSAHFGFTSYPPGWSPDGYDKNIIHGLKLYRNGQWGAFLHVTRNLIFQDCLIADNTQYSVMINRGDDIRFVNTRFIGKSEFADPSPICHFGTIGIGFHPGRLQEFDRTGTTRGSSVIDSSFENYSYEGSGCTIPPEPDTYYTPFQMRWDQVFWRAFNGAHVIDNVQVDDKSSKFDTCAMYEQLDIEDTIIEIKNDHNKVFSSSGVNGFLVNPKFSAMLPDPSSCETYSSCPSSPAGLEFCPGACLRTVTIMADPATTYNVELVAVDLNSFKSVVVEGRLREENLNTEPSIEFDRTYTVALPKGNYQFYFKDTLLNTRVWPRYADVVLESPPTSCSQYLAEGDYTFSMANLVQNRCANLIYNGHFFMDITGWIGRSGQVSLPAIFTPNEGVGGSGALKTQSRFQFQVHTVDQNLDTSCLQEGDTYSFQIKYRHIQGGVDQLVCPNGGGVSCCAAGSASCITAFIKTTDFDQGEFTLGFAELGKTNDATDYPFYTISSTWVVTAAQAAADRVTVVLTGGYAQLIVDDAFLVKIS